MRSDISTSTWTSTARERLDASLKDYFRSKRDALLAESVDQALGAELCDAVSDLTLRGGKRLRPLLLGASAWAVGGDPLDDVCIRAGASLELMQTYLLIHDDWMDRDEHRRGARSVHAQFEMSGIPEHDAGALAILAGDMGNAMAWEMMLSAAQGHVNQGAILNAFARMQYDVVVGQHGDMRGMADPITVYRLKTASYTTLGPSQLGGLIGKANAEQLTALAGFAEPLGVAFQLRDDLLGVFGDEHRTGKAVGSDLYSSKRTMVRELAEQHLDAEGVQALGELEREPRARSEGVLSRVIEAMRRASIPQMVEQRIEDLLSESLHALSAGDFADDGARALRALAQGMLKRRR